MAGETLSSSVPPATIDCDPGYLEYIETDLPDQAIAKELGINSLGQLSNLVACLIPPEEPTDRKTPELFRITINHDAYLILTEHDITTLYQLLTCSREELKKCGLEKFHIDDILEWIGSQPKTYPVLRSLTSPHTVDHHEV